jgi:hypothetical protein
MAKESTTLLTIDIPSKTYTLGGSILAVGTTATVNLKGYGNATATDLSLAIIYQGVAVATLSAFTDSGNGYFTGLLDLDTIQLWNIMGKYDEAPQLVQMGIALEDTSNSDLLMNSVVQVMNNLLAPTIIPADSMNLKALGGNYRNETSGEAIAQFKVVYTRLADGLTVHADSTALAQMDLAKGVAYSTVAATGLPILVAFAGTITNAAWTWNIGQPIYFDANGTLTQTMQTGGYIQQCAIPLTATTILIRFATPVSGTGGYVSANVKRPLVNYNGHIRELLNGDVIMGLPNQGMVFASATDPTQDYLDGKVDNSTIQVTNNKLNVKSGFYEPANANIQAHIASTSNPHSTTYSQVGAEQANANIQAHISSTSNPHSVTKTQVGLSAVPNIDATNATNISSGSLDGDRLQAPTATKRGGTPAVGATPTGTKFLADDDSYKTPSGAGDMAKADYDTSGTSSVRMARGLKESGGQELPMGAVAEGQLLARGSNTTLGKTIGNASGNVVVRSATNTVSADEVAETTATNGVLIEGVRMKDSTMKLIAANAIALTGDDACLFNTATQDSVTSRRSLGFTTAEGSFIATNGMTFQGAIKDELSYNSTAFTVIRPTTLGSFQIPIQAGSNMYFFDCYFPYIAENISYGFTLAVQSFTDATLLGYTTIIPLTATTMFYNNQYLAETGTASATVALQGVARIYGYVLSHASNYDVMGIDIKVENASHPITLKKGGFISLYKMS